MTGFYGRHFPVSQLRDTALISSPSCFTYAAVKVGQLRIYPPRKVNLFGLLTCAHREVSTLDLGMIYDVASWPNG